MQADFQAWYEPLACAAEEDEEEGKRLGRQGDGNANPSSIDRNNRRNNNHPQTANHLPSNRNNSGGGGGGTSQDNQQTVTTTTARDRRSKTSERMNLNMEGGDTTPTRRPRPPVDAWGTPPGSGNHRRGSSSSVATGNVWTTGGGGARSNDGSEAASGGGRGAVHGRGGGEGLLPPLTGKRYYRTCCRVATSPMINQRIQGTIPNGTD